MAAKKINIAEVNAKLRALMASPNGLNVFLSKITSPLKTRRDLQSGLRKVLQYDPLTAGDPPVYDIDPKGYAYQVPYQGAAPTRIVADDSAQVVIKTFDMVAYKEFPLSLINIARYDYLKRIEQVLKNALVELEDTALWQVLDRVVSDVNYPLTPGTSAGGILTPGALQGVYAQIEQFNDPAFILGNSVSLGSIRTWGADIFSPVRREAILKTGVIGYIWAASVYKSRLFPTDTVFITSDPESCGRIPERLSLQPMRADMPKSGKQGISFLQNLGICAYNPRAVGKVTIQP